MTISNSKTARFYDLCDKLKKLGLQGEIALTAGLIMIACDCPIKAKGWRAPIRKACKNNNVLLIETRPRKGFYVFTISTT